VLVLAAASPGREAGEVGVGCGVLTRDLGGELADLDADVAVERKAGDARHVEVRARGQEREPVDAGAGEGGLVVAVEGGGGEAVVVE
jgi:hypothetical protein